MKKIVSVVLVVTVIVNVLGFGFLNVRSKANPIAYAILEVVKNTAIGIVGGATGYAAFGTGEAMGEVSTQYYLNEIQQDLQNDNLVVATLDDNDVVSFSVSPSCSSESREYATILCNQLNNLDPIVRRVHSDGIGNMTAEAYKYVKNSTLQSFNDYVNAKASAEAASGVGSSLSELGAVTYPFDFTGPIPTMTLPTKTGAVSMDTDGFHFTTPYRLYSGTTFSTEEEARAHGGQTVSQSGSYYIPKQSYTAYGYGYYLIYNGVMYFNGSSSSYDEPYNYTVDSLCPLYTYNSSDWKSIDGTRLCDVVTFDMDSIKNVYGGVMFHTEKKDYDHRYPFSYSYEPSDFIVAELGEDVTFDRTPAEETIGSAMGLGLVSTNPTLTIDTTTGEITAADNIDLSTLQSLVEKLSEGQLKFEDIEGYLQSIVALLQAQGADQKTINAILQGIRSNTSSIADINAAVQSIADAMSIEAEAEIDIPDDDAETFIVSHTGLPEATTIVNGIPVVGQVTQLLNNVLDSSQYSSGAPNFKFYWDSDGDGTREVYNALDLSFLDNRIASETLSDSGRLSDSMTYRQFLHALIIFLCYVGFAIKILKKLPGLFGGSESSNEFVSSDK